MKYYSVFNLVGISVSDTYPWCETLFIKDIALEGETSYNHTTAKIHIVFERELRKDHARFIGDGAYIGDNLYIDEAYGVRLEKNSDHELTLYVSQECNEWLVIALELMLLADNKTMIHAAAVEKDGEVLLMPSWGGVGKTATVCRFVRDHGWRLLGDDLVIIGDGMVHPFLKPFVIYPYHRTLFPELFQSGENHTVKNLTISKMMSKAIPGVKRALRPFPRVLAYLRKHNPQSMRVPPQRIFTSDQLSSGGKPVRTVWLERSTKETVVYSKLSPRELASKAATVSSVELFAEKLGAVYHMCGCGLLQYDDVIARMHAVILNTCETTSCSLLEIPEPIPVSEVGGIIYEQLAEKG